MTTRADKYDAYRKALLAGGASATDTEQAIEEMKAEDIKIDTGVCPGCGAKLTRALDLRQAGPTEIAGKWFNYRCTAWCGWLGYRPSAAWRPAHP